jgi:hypothetical protein
MLKPSLKVTLTCYKCGTVSEVALPRPEIYFGGGGKRPSSPPPPKVRVITCPKCAAANRIELGPA